MEKGRVLVDKSRSGRSRPWRLHKANSLLLAESYERLRSNKALRVRNCGSTLKFGVCPEGHERRLMFADFCRVRLCPMCAWRRSLLIAHQVRVVAHEAVQREALRWLFLTLTVRNCEGEALSKGIDHMMRAWDRMARRKAFSGAVRGWFRSMEITRNAVDGSYHPHFHVLLAVPPGYFKGKGYLKHAEWVELWRSSLRVDYVPVVDVRVVKQKRDVRREIEILETKGIEVSEEGFRESELSGSAVAEIAKYSVKAEDYLVYRRYKHKQAGRKVQLVADVGSGIDERTTDEVVMTLDSAMSHRRFLAYGGLLKAVWQELQASGKVQDAESDSADLVHVDLDTSCQCSVCGSNMLEELYNWVPSLGDYYST